MAISTTIVVTLLAAFTVMSMLQMFSRLHTPTPEAASLSLRTNKGKAVADVPEFFVAGEPPPMGQSSGGREGSGYGSMAHAAQARKAAGPPPDERSNLLCLERSGKARAS